MRLKTLVLMALLLTLPAWAGDLTADGYRIALPGYHYRFPEDHGSHDDYKTEWWYYTGHLYAADGHEWGYELTFFRFAIVPPQQAASKSRWFPSQLYLAHLALTDVTGHTFQYWEKLNRHGMGVAGAEAHRLQVWNDGWSAGAEPNGDTRLKAVQGALSFDLTLHSPIEPVVHGNGGISRKGAKVSNSSHYYSYTRMATTGTLNNQSVHGMTWMDHEFGSSQLSSHQVGWNWYALQLDNNTEVMLYQMRNDQGRPDEFSSGTLIQNGKATPLSVRDFNVTSTGTWTSPHSKGVYPMGWRIDIPSAHVQATVSPLVIDQELLTNNSTGVTYWEGAASIQATVDGKPVPGRAYVEMTGYAGHIRI